MIYGLKIGPGNQEGVNKQLSPHADINRTGVCSALCGRYKIRRVNYRCLFGINCTGRPCGIGNDTVIQPISPAPSVNIPYKV